MLQNKERKEPIQTRKDRTHKTRQIQWCQTITPKSSETCAQTSWMH